LHPGAPGVNKKIRKTIEDKELGRCCVLIIVNYYRLYGNIGRAKKTAHFGAVFGGLKKRGGGPP
jgi:hypothetical protein